jgi:hypothetical protein
MAAIWVYEHADVAADKFVEACARQGVAFYQTALNGANMVYAATKGTWEGAKLIYEAGNQLRQGNFKDAGAALVIGLAKLSVEMPLDVALGSILESVSVLQSALFLEPIGRTLRNDERAFLSQVFGDSPWWFNVIRVKEGFAGLFSISGRPFTLESTIYLKNTTYSAQRMVHETTHVWQWIHGGGDYKLASIHEQIEHGQAAYDFEPALDAGKTWPNLGVEQQANFVDEAFAAPAECFAYPNSACKVSSRDRTAVFLETRDALRSGRGAP